MIVLLVLATALVLATVLVFARDRATTGAPLDLDGEESWLVTHAPGWMTPAMRTLDRRVIGGVAVGASFVVVLASATVVGWIFTGLDDDRGVARWDAAAAEYGEEHLTDASIEMLDVLTDFGGSIYLAVLLILTGAYYAVRRSDWGPAAYLAVVGIGVTLLNNGLKILVDRDRPEIGQLAGHFGKSFPSGHSASAAACWAAVALVVARRRSHNVRVVAAGVAVFVAIMVATTRVLLGAHWLSDVVAGVIVGWAWFFVTTIAFGGRLLRLGEPGERIADVEEARVRIEEEASA